MKKKLLICASVLLCVCLLFSCTGNLYEDPLRLHVIANSDSDEDQRIKFEVRDAVLRYTKDAATGFEDPDDVKRYVMDNKDGILEAANAVLKENKAEYTASLSIGRYYFPDRSYGDVLYEAGYYDAVRIVLGDGKGQNWWCVIFPPLCLINTDEELPESENIRFTSIFASLCK